MTAKKQPKEDQEAPALEKSEKKIIALQPITYNGHHYMPGDEIAKGKDLNIDRLLAGKKIKIEGN